MVVDYPVANDNLPGRNLRPIYPGADDCFTNLYASYDIPVHPQNVFPVAAKFHSSFPVEAQTAAETGPDPGHAVLIGVLEPEIIQQNPEERLEYVLTGESGPDHNKHFTVEVHLNSNVIGKGGGRSKKEAEQQAAREALELMGY